MADPIIVPVNSLWEVRLIGFLDAQQTITTWHYLNDVEVPDMGQATLELATSFGIEFWTAKIRGALSDKYLNVYVEAQCIRPVRYRSQRYIPAFRMGATGGTCNPSGVSVVIRRTTQRAGRKFQGRVYLPGIPFSAVVNSTLAQAWFDANDAPLRNSVTEDVDTVTMGSFTAVVYHPGPVTPADEIVLAKTDIFVRYQRRREIGVGI